MHENNAKDTKFDVTDLKIDVAIVSLSIKDNVKLLQQSKENFNR